MTDKDKENAGIADLIANGVPVTKALRIHSRFSLEQLSERSDIDRIRLDAIRGGSDPSLDEVRRFSAAL